jgi:hypothetical protein
LNRLIFDSEEKIRLLKKTTESMSYCSIFKSANNAPAQQNQIRALQQRKNDLEAAFKEKSKALADTRAKYDSLKTQSLAAEVQSAAEHDDGQFLQDAAPRHGHHSQRSFSRPPGAFNRPGLSVSGLPGISSRMASMSRFPGVPPWPRTQGLSAMPLGGGLRQGTAIDPPLSRPVRGMALIGCCRGGF